ncbi:MAG: sulfatase-like hydrolase/transferase [Caldilineaceae bacterium]
MRTLTRRHFIQLAAQSSVAALAAHWSMHGAAHAAAHAQPQADPPNILIVMVDQMRYPQWFDEAGGLDALPNIKRIAQGSVNFGRHYAAASCCTPSRGCMLTGLYAHQTNCLITSVSNLHPDFPTWGTFLREAGYATPWFGKWHCSEDDTPELDAAYSFLEPYGFSAYTNPDPHGVPGQGLYQDDDIAGQFTAWLGEAANQADNPWCATVSFVNPHDIMFYPRLIPPAEKEAPAVFSTLPPNYETQLQLTARQKPQLQIELIRTANRMFGEMGHLPINDDEWLKMLDIYLYMQQLVDAQVGRVLDALEAQPQIRDNTIVIFTSDHGDYCGSHGLRGKGGAVYEESIWVPFYLKDYSGKLTAQPGDRTQLTSHVDLTPLLLSIAYGGDSWRTLPQTAHLANRLDMLSIVKDPNASGRPYVLHTTDEPGLEEKEDPAYDWMPFNNDVASHVVGYRTAAGKLSTYSFWQENSTQILSDGQEIECYDYATEEGRREIDNITDADNALYTSLKSGLDDAITDELRAPLPAALQSAQTEAMIQYLLDIGQGSQIFLPGVSSGGDL